LQRRLILKSSFSAGLQSNLTNWPYRHAKCCVENVVRFNFRGVPYPPEA